MIDLTAALLTALTMYSIVITIEYIQMRRVARELRSLLRNDLADLCMDISNAFSKLANTPVEKADKESKNEHGI